MTYATVLRKLQEDGFRQTKARRAIIELLILSKHPQTISEILTKLDNNFKLQVDKTTAYREISFLLDKQVAREIDFGDKKKRYESNIGDHHHHLVCTNCGKIEDFELEQDLKEDEQRIEKNKNFKVTSHSLEFFGLCSSCKK